MKEKIIMIIMAVALYALPAVAQNMEFRSTSTMQGSGNYVAPVTAVGATSAASSYSPAKAPGGPRKVEGVGGGEGGSGENDGVCSHEWELVSTTAYRHITKSLCCTTGINNVVSQLCVLICSVLPDSLRPHGL